MGAASGENRIFAMQKQRIVSRPGLACCLCSTNWSTAVWVHARAESRNLKETVSSVPAWFRADSGTNLIKQGENVTGLSCGSVAQW